VLVYLIFQYTIRLTYTLIYYYYYYYYLNEINASYNIFISTNKFTCSFNLVNFDKILYKYEVIICIKWIKTWVPQKY